jgi:hypothetical protein
MKATVSGSTGIRSSASVLGEPIENSLEEPANLLLVAHREGTGALFAINLNLPGVVSGPPPDADLKAIPRRPPARVKALGNEIVQRHPAEV